MDRSVCETQAGSQTVAGTAGNLRNCCAIGGELPGHQPWAQHRDMALVADAVQPCPNYAADTRSHGRRRCFCSAYRLCERGQSVAGPVLHPSPRDERSSRDWRQPRAFSEAAAHRRPHSVRTRHSRWTSGRVLVPARAGVVVADTLRSSNVPAWANGRARDGNERRRRLARDVDGGDNSRLSNTSLRSGRAFEGRLLRRGRGPGKSLEG